MLHGRRHHDGGRRSLKSLRKISLAVVVAFAATACADEAFTVQYAPDYRRAPANVSFFGVYQDGRVNAESWDQFGVRIAHSFVGAPCDALYGNAFTAQDPELAGAIDSYARAGGISDDLLEKLAPMAKGDMIVVLAISGHPPQPLGDAGTRATPPEPTRNYGGGRRGGQFGGGGGGYSRDPGPTTDQNVFEIAATIYSVKAKHSVAVVAMAYTGSSVTDAMTKFTAKFSAEMTSSRCVGWSFDQKIDSDAIRKMADD